MTQIRIPNLPNGKIINDDGTATDDELTFRTTLISQLQANFNNEGCVVPTQSNSAAPDNYINQIQNNQNAQGQYTCGFGRFLYDSTNNRILVSIDTGGGVPGFAEVNITMPPLVPPV